MSAHVKDMTHGSPARLITGFALPLMLGNVFQQLYTTVDTAIVGQFAGIEALAALGAADWLNWMSLGIITGFAGGFSIPIAQRFGAGDLHGLRKAVGMSALLGAVIAVLLTAAFHLAARPVLLLLNTPDNVLPQALVYLRVMFSGLCIVMFYNVLASLLRALGDGRTPLVVMIIACAINVGLDLLFVAVFHWGVGGAAAATLIAQAFSALFCLRAVCRLPMLRMTREAFCPDHTVAGTLVRLGTPMALQNAIIAVGGMGVQYVINGFGFVFVAGFTATNKLYGLLEIAATSFGFAMATFTGQNLGAGQLERIKRGLRASAIIGVLTALCIGGVMAAAGRWILALFVSASSADAPAVLDVAYRYLCVMCAALSVLYLLYVYRSALQGMGDTVIPMISGIVELIMRLSVAWLLPLMLGQDGVYYAEIAAWTGATVLLAAAYYVRIHRLERRAAAGMPLV